MDLYKEHIGSHLHSFGMIVSSIFMTSFEPHVGARFFVSCALEVSRAPSS